MNKKELIKQVSDETGCQICEVSNVVDAVLSNITKCLGNGEKVVLKDFGTFQPTLRKKKIGRNIGTRESVVVPEHMIPDFKPGKLLKDIVKGADVFVNDYNRAR